MRRESRQKKPAILQLKISLAYKIKRHRLFYTLRDYFPYYWVGKITTDQIKVEIHFQNHVRIRGVNYVSIVELPSRKQLSKPKLEQLLKSL